MNLARRFFGQFDMFAAPPTLRAHQDDKTTSLCSGVISFLLALFFSYVFINLTIGVMTFNKIDSVQTESRLPFDQVKAQDVFFAIRTGYLVPEISIKYFQIGFYVVTEDGNNQTYQFQKCTPQQWKKLGDNYQQQYKKFSLEQFFCSKSEAKISIKKVFYAPNSQYAAIFVKLCSQNSSQYCQTPDNQQQFLQNLKNIEGAIFIQLYFMDQTVNPNSKVPVSYFTNTDVQFAITLKRGIIATIQLASYTVQTDVSVFPVQQIDVQEGNFLHSFRQTSIEINSAQDVYATIYISMNRKHIMVQRVVGKLDQLLSYAGGLFSIIIGFLSAFFLSFNKYRYQLMVAQGIFHQDQDGNSIKQHQFSFPLYIKYIVFDWILTLFCYKAKWQDCNIIDSTRDEANKQMDVTRLFRKIQSLQIAVSHLIVNRKERQCLALLKPSKLSDIIRKRMTLQYYDRIIDGRSSLTFSQYRISHQILKFGLMLLKNQQQNNPNRINNLDTTNQYLQNESQIDYELLKNREYLIQIIEKKFKEIVNQAKLVQLQEQETEVQIQLAQALFQLQQQKKNNFVQQIPIKILYRLAKKYHPRVNQEASQIQQKGKKRVILNILSPIKKKISLQD